MITRLNSNDVNKVICIGPTGKYMAQELRKIGFSNEKIEEKDDVNNWSMNEIVEIAQKSAVTGDIVLLSTGSASFGIFKDYKERGDKFTDCVNSL